MTELNLEIKLIESSADVLLLQVTKPRGGRYYEVLRSTLLERKDSNYRGFPGFALFGNAASKDLAFIKFEEAKERSAKQLKKIQKINSQKTQ